MPRGSSRQFRELYDGAAERLGVGGSANRVDSGFLARARGALESQGFSVSGRNVSRQFQETADLAQAELGLSAFTAQTMSLDFDKTEVLRSLPGPIGAIETMWRKPGRLSRWARTLASWRWPETTTVRAPECRRM